LAKLLTFTLALDSEANAVSLELLTARFLKLAIQGRDGVVPFTEIVPPTQEDPRSMLVMLTLLNSHMDPLMEIIRLLDRDGTNVTMDTPEKLASDGENAAAPERKVPQFCDCTFEIVVCAAGVITKSVPLEAGCEPVSDRELTFTFHPTLQAAAEQAV
jgi:hypothetical protein